MTGLYASGLTACSSVKTKADVTHECKTGLGGTATCFGAAPVADVVSDPTPSPTATTVSTHVVKMAVSLPMSKEAFNADKQTKFIKVCPCG